MEGGGGAGRARGAAPPCGPPHCCLCISAALHGLLLMPSDLRAAACCAPPLRARASADAATPPCGPPRCFPRPSALPRASPLLHASAFRRAGLRRRSPRASALRPKRPSRGRRRPIQRPKARRGAPRGPEGARRHEEMIGSSGKVDPSREASSDGEVAAVGGERDAGSSGACGISKVTPSVPGVLSQRGAAVARRSSEPISGGLLPGHGRPEDGSRRWARGGEGSRKHKEAGLFAKGRLPWQLTSASEEPRSRTRQNHYRT